MVIARSEFDIVVIGAGAAGMIAAARAAEAMRSSLASSSSGDASVLLLEKNRKAGAKILMSGGTRCNLTHDCGNAGIMEAFGKSGRFLRQALDQLSPQATVKMFHDLGVATKIESTGKVFPKNDRAVEVRDALLRDVHDQGVQVRLGAGVQGLRRQEGCWEVHTDSGTVFADKVIVTAGGRSWPGCGTTGDAYEWLSQLGHSIEQTRPALVPLTGGADWSRELSGLTLPEIGLEVWASAKPRSSTGSDGRRSGKRKKPLIRREGGFLFTHRGFSGPAVMDVSRYLTTPDGVTDDRLVIDLLPAMSTAAVEDWIADIKRKGGGQTLANALTKLLPSRLASAIAQLAIQGSDVPRAGSADQVFPLAELKREVWSRLSGFLKQHELPVHGSRGFEKAEVTAGGVRLSEVDPRTMQSRLVDGLYIAGEVLDLDGWIGGYNFQSAFSTGAMAGLAAAESIRNGEH